MKSFNKIVGAGTIALGILFTGDAIPQQLPTDQSINIATPCGQYDALVMAFAENGLKRAWYGPTVSGMWSELFLAEDGKWAFITTDGNKTTCVKDLGMSYEVLEYMAGKPA